jgi:hypothetical protein
VGRPPKLTPQQQKEAQRRRAEGPTLKELARSYNVGRATMAMTMAVHGSRSMWAPKQAVQAHARTSHPHKPARRELH